MNRSHLGLLALGLLFSSVGVTAQSVVTSWVLSGQPGNQAFTAGTGSEHVSAANMVRGAGLAAAGAGSSMSSTGWDSSSLDDYFELGFTVDAGFALDLSELRIGTRSSNTGPGTIGVFTSFNNYSTPFTTITQSGTAVTNSVIDLSSLAPITGVFALRLYEIGNTQADGDGATAAGGTFRINNFVLGTVDSGSAGLTGTVSPIPEPSTYAVIFGGLTFGIVVLRRRLRR